MVPRNVSGAHTGARHWRVVTNERDGWKLAGTIVPIAYIAWSGWLVLIGLALLL